MYKTATNTTLPYHSNLPQCNQNFNNISKSIPGNNLKKDEEKKKSFSIKMPQEMTVGNFLTNKNMQQQYFSYLKNPGKEPEEAQATAKEVTQVIEKPAVTTQITSNLSNASVNSTTNALNGVGSITSFNSSTIPSQTVTKANSSITTAPSVPTVHTVTSSLSNVPSVTHTKQNSTTSMGNPINHALRTANQLSQMHHNQSQVPVELLQNTPKGFYTPKMMELEKGQNQVNQGSQQGFSKQKTATIQSASQEQPQLQIPSYPTTITNFNIQNYNFNNFNTNVTTTQSTFPNQQQPRSHSELIDDSEKFASSNLNLTTASGKSINIQKTSTIPKNNALVKNNSKQRINLTDNSEKGNFLDKDFIPLKNKNLALDANESLKNYIVRSFEKCNTETDRKKCEQALQRIITNAKKKGQLATRNWNKFPLPKLPHEIEESVNSILLNNFYRKA